VRYGLEIEGRASGKGKVRKKGIRLNQQQRQELEKTQGWSFLSKHLKI